MADRTNTDELAGLLSLGLLAERVIRALGRVGRNEPLSEVDAHVLREAQTLFEWMAEEEVVVVRAGSDQMLTDETYLDALQVVQIRSGEDLPERVKRYVELLRCALENQIDDEERAELSDLRDLFVAVGETTLMRANEVSRVNPEPAWRPALLTTSRF